MSSRVIINPPISNYEVPKLRELVGWARRDNDYPTLFERCNFWAGIRDTQGDLIAFGYVCGMGLEHGYMEDIMVHPDYRGHGLGIELVKKLLEESKHFGLDIVSVTYEEDKAQFYEKCGFTPGLGAIWKRL
ncbi:N-acetyltransferase [Filobacillus milosensis]|uniref:N-acetyltransferase n=1 Tax=Filobacillus milosensis TaxID=94137 RepID=A0A4Y8IMU9_9BACI|nr:GNAT family N-acetyltransferase [Filobacillus milosensis]TFB19560.1 N-acetyltransferase [Filobacillus milosensis]